MKAQIDAHELGLEPSKGGERDLFAWLVASFLFGKRIQQDIAKAAYQVIVEKHQIDTVAKMAACTHRQLVSMLGEGRYSRYDESTATRLTALCKGIQRDYQGSVKQLIEQSADKQELSTRLQAFVGVGPKTAEIFIRDAWQNRQRGDSKERK
jgi:endonuclease III